MSLRVVTLVSEGFHPETQRPRRADCDARALDMALQLPGARVSALHAGDPASPALRDYLGMGLTDLTVLEVARECDVGAALIDYLANEKPDVILAGQQADQSETGGFLPYKIAQELRYLLLPMACSMQIDGDAVEILQARPKGKRRRLKAALPAVITVSPAAPAPRQVAFAKQRRGHIDAKKVSAHDQSAPLTIAPAKRRPKGARRVDADLSPEERLKAVAEMAGKQGEVLSGLSPEDAADKLLTYLTSNGFITPTSPQATEKDNH